MANELIALRAKAKRLTDAGQPIEGFTTMSVDELRVAVEQAEFEQTNGGQPNKGSTRKSASDLKGAAKGAATKGSANGKSTTASKGAAKPAAAKGAAKGAAKPAPAAKSTATAKKGSTATGKGEAKRPATAAAKGATAKSTPTKGSTAKTASTRTRRSASNVLRNPIDNSAVDWTLESTVGQSGNRKAILTLLRKFKGDKDKVFAKLEGDAKSMYPKNKLTGKARTIKDAKVQLRWHIGRVALDYVTKTGQHEQGTRAGYGTSDKPQDVRRREQRAKALRAAGLKPKDSPTLTPNVHKGNGEPSTKGSAAPRKASTAAKGDGKASGSTRKAATAQKGSSGSAKGSAKRTLAKGGSNKSKGAAAAKPAKPIKPR